MNQDPTNPIVPTSAAPTAPVAPDFSNPAAAATPAMDLNLGTAPAMPEAPAMEATPETPSIPDAPSIDPSLLQQAIADVPDEAAATTPEVPSAISLDNLGAASEETPTPEINPLTTAAPAADFSTPSTTPADPATLTDDAQKTPPSVAFNDPASQPDTPKPHNVQLPSFITNLKNRPVVLIVGGALIIIVALVLIIAFAI